MSALCEFDHATVAYGGVRALDDFSLTLQRGQGVVGIIGPNGAGKSTALNVLTGARPVDGGRAQVLGRSLTRRMSTTRVARLGVARTFQIPRPFADMTVRDNIRVAFIAQRSRRRETRVEVRVDEIVERIGLGPHADLLAGGLALASRKKLEFGRAFATEPALILLDEVFEGLSDREIHELVDILRSVHEDGVELVLVEHVLRALRMLASSLVVMEKGGLVAQGPVAEVLASDRVKEAYLGVGT